MSKPWLWSTCHASCLKRPTTGGTGTLPACDYDDVQVLGLKVPHVEASLGVPRGRGFYARRKQYVCVKIAEPPAAAKLAAWQAAK